MKFTECGFELNRETPEKIITVGRICIDEAAIERSNAEIEKMFKEHQEWLKTATPEMIAENQRVWEGFGGGH